MNKKAEIENRFFDNDLGGIVRLKKEDRYQSHICSSKSFPAAVIKKEKHGCREIQTEEGVLGRVELCDLKLTLAHSLSSPVICCASHSLHLWKGKM